MTTPTIHLYKNDLPDGLVFKDAIAVDSEAMGLDPKRDRLCVVQLSGGDGVCHLVQIAQGQNEAPNLKRLMEDPKIVKIFHFARFDVMILKHALGIRTNPVFCTKIASKLARTYTDRHGYKDVCRELAHVEISKEQQSSDWGHATLSEEQLLYAATDVLYLHEVRERLMEMLAREGRTQLAQSCFDFLHTRTDLDLAGWAETDIFAHK
ncbi:ribonuclease D [Magnetovibrio blakemorei]|uniref:3'-5' exonuclease n=1 Tax=Magnetovibrio blakemorei TaxID=28181 RepID=A0A1E5Q489_9PROT|nr:ribonuclease D [Magnetovibrio blakemorei]OEJ64130.1 3'-5' exonuclease [Magnetovibrio blakemorei]